MTIVNQPGYTDQTRDVVASGYANQAAKDFGNNAAKANAGVQNLREQNINYDPSKLDVNTKSTGENKNIAKGGSQFGSYNNKDYSTTLRLARQADAYNAKPRAEARHYGPHGQVQNLGYGYEKPNLQTMETRTANQALQLDTNQKQLAQQLQAAVNAKNLEAFKQVYAQMLGINLTDYQAKNMMTNMQRSQQIMQAFNRSAQMWQRNFGIWDKSDLLASLNAIYPSNPLIAPMYAMFGFGEAPNLEAIAATNNYTNMYNKLISNGVDPMLAYYMAQANINSITARTEDLMRRSDKGKAIGTTDFINKANKGGLKA